MAIETFDDLEMNYIDRFVHKEFIRQEYSFGQVYKYLDRYMDWEQREIASLTINPKVKKDKTIWFLWMQGLDSAPRLVKKCYESIIANKPDDYDVVVLDDENLTDYLKLPECVIDKFSRGMITKTHLSDIIRAGLLFLYGGCWIDSTVYCMERIPDFMLEGELFVFRFPGIMTKTVLEISSWWIRAKSGSRLMEAVWRILEYYWSEEEELIDYYLFHIIFSKLVNEDKKCGELLKKSLYYNSGNAHVLYSKMNKAYDQQEWDSIKAISPVQKLSYKSRFLQGDLDSYYMHIVS